MNRVPLLLIDLDNTLVDRDAAFHSAVTDLIAEHGLPEGDVELIMKIDASGYTPRSQVASAIADRYSPRLAPADVLEFLQRGARDRVRITPETRQALVDARAAGHPVVIVTNGTVAQQTGKIRTAGLDRLVDGWVISESAGARKPEPEIFQAAAATIGADLKGAWVIGDRDDADILGAHRLRLSSVWLHLGRAWSQAGYAPTHSVDTAATAIDRAIG